MKGGETVDVLRDFGLRVIQQRSGYRFSVDPLLLCDFVGIREGEEGADLGTGCGVIPLILARMAAGTRFVGIEHQQALAELAGRNAALNSLSDRITIAHNDILEIKSQLPDSSFDLVVSNPPYRKRGSGRISPVAGRDGARHESTAGLKDFLSVAKYLVRVPGRICMISHPSRLPELMVEASGLKLAPLRLRMVYDNPDAEGRMFLVELVKGRKGDLRVLPPLFVNNGERKDR